MNPLKIPSSRRLGWEVLTLGYVSECKVQSLRIGYASITVFVLALSSNSGFPRFGYPGVVFLLIEFPLR
jgi:hypothetical protein